MKILIGLCFIFLISLPRIVVGQKIVVDSSFASAYLKKDTTNFSKPSTEKLEDDDSLTSLVSQIGEGIWKRLKYRLNLEGIKEGIENKKEKYVSSDDKEEKKDAGG